MRALADSSVLIDFLRGHDQARRLLSDAILEGAVIGASTVTVIEVLRGVRSAERDRTAQLMRQLTWVPLSAHIASAAGRLGRHFRRTHPGIGTPALAIAATALAIDAPLWTTNVKHFPMFEDLQPPY